MIVVQHIVSEWPHNAPDAEIRPYLHPTHEHSWCLTLFICIANSCLIFNPSTHPACTLITPLILPRTSTQTYQSITCSKDLYPKRTERISFGMPLEFQIYWSEATVAHTVLWVRFPSFKCPGLEAKHAASIAKNDLDTLAQVAYGVRCCGMYCEVRLS